MKLTFFTLVTVLLLGLTRALAHGGAELGPNGGRILEFSKDGTMHGEVTLANGVFHVALLDKAMKPVELKDQVLTVTGGDRNKPEKPEVRKEGNHFVFTALKGDSYPLVFQFQPSAGARKVTTRMTFDATTCSACKNPEWLCKCGADDEHKDHKK